MKLISRLTIFAVLFASTCPAFAAEQTPADSMLEKIQTYHKDSPASGQVLRIIYFHADGMKPQKNYQDRITRIMLDIQKFYRNQMKRNGFGEKTFPLEMKDDHLVIHLVEGRHKPDKYSYRSGAAIAGELQTALAEKFNVRGEYVLVFHGLVEKKGEHHFRMFAPYYGDGMCSQLRGMCHVADCEDLDPRNITKRKTPFVFEEMIATYKTTLGAFNCTYLGGTAHELGHGLGLPHNRQRKDQNATLGTALMGSGNYTYRKELWGEKGSFLSFAHAARLASHPLFSSSDRGRWQRPTMTLDSLEFANEKDALVISGAITSNLPAYAVVAYTDPDGDSDYNAQSWTSTIENGKFRILSRENRPGHHQLRLTFCFANGAVSVTKLLYEVDDKGHISAKELNGRRQLDKIEKAYLGRQKEQALKMAKEMLPKVAGTRTEKKLQHLIAIQKQQEVVDLAKVKSNTASLSDVNWKEAKMGWGRPCRNLYTTGPATRSPLFLESATSFFPKGLYAHAPSRYVFDLDGKWKTFESTGALQASTPGYGSAVFIIKGDGKELFKSETLKAPKTADIKLDVKGVKTLELIIESGKQGNAGCWSIWGNPRVSR